MSLSTEQTSLPPAPGGLPASASLSETVISPDPGVRFFQSLRDLWAYRDLFIAFVARDIKVRYRQTALGVIWVVLQPLMTGGLLAILFKSAGIMSDIGAMDSMLFFMAGLVPWTAFALAVQTSSTSMEVNANLITKVYFPRMLIPGAHVCGSLLDFIIAFSVLVVMAAFSGALRPALILVMPLLVIVQVMAATGIGLFFGALNAQYRDVKYVVPFLLQMGMLLTVLIPLDTWNSQLRPVLSFNPMAAVVETYRALLGLSGAAASVDSMLLVKGAVVSALLLVFGIWFFRKREAKMVDIL